MPAAQRVLLIVIFQCILGTFQAQPPAAKPGSGKGNLPMVRGLLLESGTGLPLPFATISVFSLPDSMNRFNAYSKEDGSFSLPVSPGRYYLQFQYVGFGELLLSPVVVPHKGLDLGEVVMEADAVSLQQIEVRAERSQMEFKLDRRVFHVGKDLTNAGNSAADILDKVPSVTVDPEGNVSLRGSQSVRILVNGKPSGLLSAGETEALLRMQGDIIESVEVITNPSARYEAEGEAGIINIILKKNKGKGFNGSFGTTVGYPTNLGASYNLNYRRRDLNFFSNFGLDFRKTPGGGFSTQQFYDDGMLTSFFTSETDQTRGGLAGYLQMGLDWNMSDRDVLTGSLLYKAGEDDNNATVVYRDLDASGDLLQTTTRDVDEIEREHNLEGALNFTRNFREEDRKWTIDLKYILDDDTELADYYQTISGMSEALVQESSNTEDETNFLFQSDYVHPFGPSALLEGGLRLALRTVDNDFFVREERNGTFITLQDFDDRLRYTEDIYAGYLIGATEFGALGVQAGLRAELSDITAELVRSGESNDQDYLSFFPSASLSYQLSESDQLQVSYSRRLSRPYFRRLLPFSNFNNPRNNTIGNPSLRPEFTHSFEGGYLRYFDSGTFLAGLYYRRTTGVIERLTLPAEDGTAIEYPVNLSERDAYGLELNGSFDLTDWWDLNTDLNLYREILNGRFEGVDYSAEAFTWTGRFSSKIRLDGLFEAQVSFDYNAPRNTTQGRRLSSYNLDFGFSRDILSGKGTLTLTGRDLFNTRKRRIRVDLPDYRSETVFQWRQRRQVVLSFSYRLNQDKEKGLDL